LYVVKRIFRYLKGQPKLGLWYPRDSPFDLEAYSDGDYARASLDRKSTIGEYVAAANCCGHMLWIQNQMLDYGFNFLNTKIYIDNEIIGEKVNTIRLILILLGKGKPNERSLRYLNLVDLLILITDETVYKEWEDIMERAGEESTVPVESHHIPSGDLTISQPLLSSPSRLPTLPNDSPLLRGGNLGDRIEAKKQIYGAAFTKLIKKVKKLEKTVKTSQARRRAKIMISEDDMALEDSSKQGRVIEDIDQDEGVILVTPIKVSSQEDQPEDQLGVLSAAKILADATRDHTYSRKKKSISTAGMVQETKRNKPMTQAQQRTYMSNYIKHMGSYTLKQLKKLSFEEIKELFEATMKRIQDFVPMEIEGDKEVSKFTGARGLKRDSKEEIDQGSSKKQYTDEASGSVQEQQVEEEKELSQEDLQ
nr:hypothetical protein [Tanacetum cinerariifolium]